MVSNGILLQTLDKTKARCKSCNGSCILLPLTVQWLLWKGTLQRPHLHFPLFLQEVSLGVLMNEFFTLLGRLNTPRRRHCLFGIPNIQHFKLESIIHLIDIQGNYVRFSILVLFRSRNPDANG